MHHHVYQQSIAAAEATASHRLHGDARQLAQTLARSHRSRLVAECRAAGGADGAALAYALLDMIGDGDVPLHVMPLDETAALLVQTPTLEPSDTACLVAALIAAVAASDDTDPGASFAGDKAQPGAAALLLGAAA